ncbi:hypothetical protein A8F94_21260 [Bacillus sp. FJAT-27225]|uniref:DNA-directed RNA polymerase subunit beta n=1 Tax=Bacillus sp. FJAT-27225 TaxID=1743144 RepID=UPI00080C2B72|nr:DNA-directed RNA polymerase subunit beta [Bacillus sp. FJAT-27225]OCA82434.1 hypothetical protein A8F94_21260 [Bacillus sp. FJAT-27225]
MSSTTYKQEQPKTREEVKKARRTEHEKAVPAGSNRKRVRTRLIPIWLKLVLFILLVTACAGLGVMFGYGVLGDGKPTDIFNESTWTHIRDLVTKK